MFSCPILTYHSQNIGGSSYAENDHVALADDLLALHLAGHRIIPMDRLADWMDGSEPVDDTLKPIVLTFDDGCNFDVQDLDYPEHGPQRSFTGILEDFSADHGPDAQSELHATSFVIASRRARELIDKGSLFGRGWISDDWWRTTDQAGLVAIENHGWDHNHPDVSGTDGGTFHTVDTHHQCLEQVVRAAAAIESRTGRWPNYFAYPFGESSEYIRDSFFPSYPQTHGCRAALGTEAGCVTRESDRWNLPRLVCGRDWTSVDELLEVIQPVTTEKD